MPIYEYRCRNGHEFEVFQSMSEDPVKRCSECGAPVERVFRPVAVHFKGSGFYTTDYAKSGAKPKPDSDGASGGDSDSGKADKKSDARSKSESSGDKAKAKSAD
jgi:putative FmdB family regulatory protein